jgi:DNA sulfur modification protein DndC
MEKGFEYLEPMADFRDWLKDYCYIPENRMTTRRNGSDGVGPLTFEARQVVLGKLEELQQKVGHRLISDAEVGRIKQIWLDDTSTVALQKANKLLGLMEERDAK